MFKMSVQMMLESLNIAAQVDNAAEIIFGVDENGYLVPVSVIQKKHNLQDFDPSEFQHINKRFTADIWES